MQNLCTKDFHRDTKYNSDTKNQLWMSIIGDAHDIICDCWHPYAHMLSNIFPPGHKDRDLSINQILERDYSERCHSGGDDAENHGLADGGATTGGDVIDPEEREEEYIKDDELTELIKAAEDAATR